MANPRVIRIGLSNRTIRITEQGRTHVVGPAGKAVRVSGVGLVVNNASGTSAQVHNQVAASASWIISHLFGRLPHVSVYLSSGEQIETDVTSTSTQVNITFPAPVSGTAILS